MPVEAGDDKPVWRAILDRIKKALAEGVLVKLECNSIRPLPGQPRDYFDPSGMDKLEKSIREVGQIQCGLVRRVPEDALITHELLDGERRWRVCSRISTVQYRAIEVDIDDEAAPFIVAAIANFNRADHTPLEIAMAIEKLHQRLGAPMPVVADHLAQVVHLPRLLGATLGAHVAVGVADAGV
jgi:ParB/RepB/Spo0J family partition protein